MSRTHLIIVPCHSIWTGGAKLGEDSGEWLLQTFQVEGNDHLAFIDHLMLGQESLLEDEKAILVISGGRTKLEAGSLSEAESYHRLLDLKRRQSVHKQIDEIESRTFVEPFAKDSFENILYLICRFYDVCGRYPKCITICGFEFKKDRFLQLHLQRALGFDLKCVNFKGNSPNPVFQGPKRDKYFEELAANERKTYNIFKKDLYGLGPVLMAKRTSRNPFKEAHNYKSENPDISLLLSLMKDVEAKALELSAHLKLNFPW